MSGKRNTKRNEDPAGLSLIEVMLSMLVLSIASLGMMSYHREAGRQTYWARAQLSATRIAQLLLEDWKANGASLAYNPQDLELDFVNINESSDNRGNILKKYQTTIDNLRLHISMIRPINIIMNPFPINVVVQWSKDGGSEIQPDSPSVVLSTLARGDEAAG